MNHLHKFNCALFKKVRLNSLVAWNHWIAILLLIIVMFAGEMVYLARGAIFPLTDCHNQFVLNPIYIWLYGNQQSFNKNLSKYACKYAKKKCCAIQTANFLISHIACTYVVSIIIIISYIAIHLGTAFRLLLHLSQFGWMPWAVWKIDSRL